MMTPRCGVADIINGTSSMRAGKKRHHHGHNTIHTVSHYDFFQGNPRWPDSKTHLTYGFLPGTQSNVMSPITQAFDKWASATHFTFSQIQDYTNADLKVAFYRGDHGDGNPFDGPGGVLAHAFAPTNGRFHYDADEQWSIGPVPNAFDLETVALHEIGHLLGLAHSSVEDAIMYPSIPSGVTKGSSAPTKGGKPSPFEFLEHLQGCHKGEKIKGLQELKKYLEKFGYLNYDHSKNHTHANDDDFDDLLESAIKTYQLNYHLKTTGALDVQTVSKMMMPRCGVADIINGTSSMRAGKKRHHHGHNTIHTVSHYAFFQGNPRWPDSKTHLTYGFLPGTQSNVMSPITQAFDKWASATHFTFSQIQDYTNADLKVAFYRGDHGDGNPFDGPGGVLAHAFAPTNGRFHYDADEQWSIGPVPNAFDLETVALHEIGHLLGLSHSSVEDAIMYPSIPSGVTKGLNGDDIQGIKALYNV
ncbi:hypothetical protein F0562_004691 [Nyssa sinensis]|uniref:Peptidase metallopeptidase domain-containing protein n=1 Tax=Nyssa sinensis TaxID=561372 RepID=A0A5J5BYN0_9ASTE|nr:hypothetical protein F0562_004691 [Nyssa sinensis]